MARLRLLLLAAIVLVMVGCPLLEEGLPANTISFTLDGAEYSYSASSGLSTHAWGRGVEWNSAPPDEYFITASLTEADALVGINTIELQISSEGDYWLSVTVYDDEGTQFYFDLGSADHLLLAGIIRNLDEVGEQMQGAFLGPYEYVNGSTHILENILFSVERLEDYAPEVQGRGHPAYRLTITSHTP
jgi:hypothetical protein